VFRVFLIGVDLFFGGHMIFLLSDCFLLVGARTTAGPGNASIFFSLGDWTFQRIDEKLVSD
jgi:hypothetical protein